MEHQYITLLNNKLFVANMLAAGVAENDFKEIIEELTEYTIDELVLFLEKPLMFGIENNSNEIKVIEAILEIINKPQTVQV